MTRLARATRFRRLPVLLATLVVIAATAVFYSASASAHHPLKRAYVHFNVTNATGHEMVLHDAHLPASARWVQPPPSVLRPRQAIDVRAEFRPAEMASAQNNNIRLGYKAQSSSHANPATQLPRGFVLISVDPVQAWEAGRKGGVWKAPKRRIEYPDRNNPRAFIETILNQDSFDTFVKGDFDRRSDTRIEILNTFTEFRHPANDFTSKVEAVFEQKDPEADFQKVTALLKDKIDSRELLKQLNEIDSEQIDFREVLKLLKKKPCERP